MGEFWKACGFTFALPLNRFSAVLKKRSPSTRGREKRRKKKKEKKQTKSSSIGELWRSDELNNHQAAWTWVRVCSQSEQKSQILADRIEEKHCPSNIRSQADHYQSSNALSFRFVPSTISLQSQFLFPFSLRFMLMRRLSRMLWAGFFTTFFWFLSFELRSKYRK